MYPAQNRTLPQCVFHRNIRCLAQNRTSYSVSGTQRCPWNWYINTLWESATKCWSTIYVRKLFRCPNITNGNRAFCLARVKNLTTYFYFSFSCVPDSQTPSRMPDSPIYFLLLCLIHLMLHDNIIYSLSTLTAQIGTLMCVI